MRISYDMQKKIKYIKHHKLEEAFPEQVLKKIELHSFEQEEYICLAGEELEYFYILVAGTCKVVPSSEDGKQVILSFLESTEFVGDIELLHSRHTLHNVVAHTPVVLLAISRDIFLQDMLQHLPFVTMTAKHLAKKIYLSSRQYSSNLLYPIKNRLSRHLSNLSKQQETLRIKIKMQETAQYLGVSTRHLRRVIQELEQENTIRKIGNEVTIVNQASIEQLASYY